MSSIIVQLLLLVNIPLLTSTNVLLVIDAAAAASTSSTLNTKQRNYNSHQNNKNNNVDIAETLKSLGMSTNEINTLLGSSSVGSTSTTTNKEEDNHIVSSVVPSKTNHNKNVTSTTKSRYTNIDKNDDVDDESENVYLMKDAADVEEDESEYYDTDNENEDDIDLVKEMEEEIADVIGKNNEHEDDDWWKDPFADFDDEITNNEENNKEIETEKDDVVLFDFDQDDDETEYDSEDLDEESLSEKEDNDDDDFFIDTFSSIDAEDKERKGNKVVNRDHNSLLEDDEYDYEDEYEYDFEDDDDVEQNQISQDSTVTETDITPESTALKEEQIQVSEDKESLKTLKTLKAIDNARKGTSKSLSNISTAFSAFMIPQLGRSMIQSPLPVQLFAGAAIANIAFHRLRVRKRKTIRNIMVEDSDEQSEDIDSDRDDDILVSDKVQDYTDDEAAFVNAIRYGRPLPVHIQSTRQLVDGDEPNAMFDDREEGIEKVNTDSETEMNSTEEELIMRNQHTGDAKHDKQLNKKKGRGSKKSKNIKTDKDKAVRRGQVRKVFGRRINLRKEIEAQFEEIEYLKELFATEQATRQKIESDYNAVQGSLDVAKKQLSELTRMNKYLQSQVTDKTNALERAVVAERQRTNDELARVREKMTSVLGRERRMMKAQLMKYSDIVKAIVAAQQDYGEKEINEENSLDEEQ